MTEKQEKKRRLPLVALFGQTNVGKSSLFNKLTEKHSALVSNIAGTTRDANTGTVAWASREFNLVDTGGIIDLSSLFLKKNIPSSIEARVQKQVKDNLKKADIILFVVDAKLGYREEDGKVAVLLKRIFPKLDHLILVVNKVDTPKDAAEISDFYKLSLGEPNRVSANTGSCTGDLLDVVVKKLEKEKLFNQVKVEEEQVEEQDTIKVCLLGKPNVGKSSLLNKFFGKEKMIVSEIAHTTRESQDFSLGHKDKTLTFIDTAGLARTEHRKVRQNKAVANNRLKNESELAMVGMIDSLSSVAKADIVLFMIDVTSTITQQDAKIIEEIVDRRKSIIIIANKWDLIAERDVEKFKSYILDKFPYIAWVPIHFCSAKTGLKVDKLFDFILEVAESRKIELSNSVLNKFLVKLVKIHKPAKGKGLKPPRIYELSQSGSNPPEFKIRIGPRDNLHFSYVNFIQNRLREKFGFIGTPINIWVKKGR